jgi:hypothetical protein
MHAAPAVSCAICTKKCAHEHTGSAEALRHSLRNGFTAYIALSPVNGYRMHRSLLQRRAETDSLWMSGSRRAVLCRWRLDWGDLAIAAWKKGGLVIRGAGSTTLFVHQTPCREPGARGSVHAFSAQRQGRCRRDGQSCGVADGRAGCRS